MSEVLDEAHESILPSQLGLLVDQIGERLQHGAAVPTGQAQCAEWVFPKLENLNVSDLLHPRPFTCYALSEGSSVGSGRIWIPVPRSFVSKTLGVAFGFFWCPNPAAPSLQPLEPQSGFDLDYYVLEEGAVYYLCPEDWSDPALPAEYVSGAYDLVSNWCITDSPDGRVLHCALAGLPNDKT